MKKYTARKVDELGRIILPIEMRKQLGINENNPVDMVLDGGNITITKSVPTCVVCDGQELVRDFNGKPLCNTCYTKLTA